MPSRRQVRTANTLLATTGNAAASVIAARMLAFSDPATLLSPWHQSEARRMTAEKLDAAGDGMRAAGMELAMLPARLMMIGARPAAWTPAGWMNACSDAAALWFGVGNAAVRPARNTAVRNQRRLARPHR